MKPRPSCAHPGLAFETIPAPGPWIARAACAGEPTDLFFPDDDNATDVARSICSRCAVRGDCIGYAIEFPSLAGIWGGLTQQERSELRRRRRCSRSARSAHRAAR